MIKLLERLYVDGSVIFTTGCIVSVVAFGVYAYLRLAFKGDD